MDRIELNRAEGVRRAKHPLFRLCASPQCQASIKMQLLSSLPPCSINFWIASAAVQPWETVCNVFLGDALFEDRVNLLSAYQIEVRREYRKTKEYEEQEVYPILFHNRPVIGDL